MILIRLITVLSFFALLSCSEKAEKEVDKTVTKAEADAMVTNMMSNMRSAMKEEQDTSKTKE